MSKSISPTFIIILSCIFLCAHRAYGDDTWSFAVVGDTRGIDTSTTTGVSTYLPAIATKINSLSPKAVFVNGDLINGNDLFAPGGSQPDYRIQYDTQFANWKAAMAPVYAIPIYTVRGNHENNANDNLPPDSTLNPTTLTTSYYNAFGSTTPVVGNVVLPRNGPNNSTNDNQVGYSWNLSSQIGFNQKYVRVIGVDQYFYYNSIVRGASGNPTNYYKIDQTWLDEQLTKTAPKRYTFVMAHEPVYSLDNTIGDYYGTINSSGSTYLPGVADRMVFWDSLGTNGVKMYLVGHMHDLQVGTARDSSGNTIYQNLSGNGGASPLEPQGTPESAITLTYQNFTNYGFVLYTVTKDNITINYYLYNPTAPVGSQWSIAAAPGLPIVLNANPVNTWTGTNGDNNWATGGNWDVGAAPPDNTYTAVFNSGAGTNSTVNFTGNVTNKKLFVASGATTFNLGSKTYTAITATAIDGTEDATYLPSLTIAGDGSKLVTGALTMDAGATLTVQDTASVEATTLEMDGVSAFTVGAMASATCGTITIGSSTCTITESGNVNFTTLDVGTNNLTVTGAYIQPAGSTLKFTEASASSYGHITSGTGTTLAQASTVNVTVDSYIPNHTNFTVVNTGGKGIGNVPATITSSSPSVVFSAVDSGGNLVLSNTNDISALAANSNAANVGTVLDNITNPSADMTTVLNAMVLSSSGQVAASLNSMTPTVDGAVTQSAISMLNQIMGSTVTHLENVGTTDETGISTGDDYLQGLDIWAQGLGDYAHQDPRGFSNGYNATSWGVSGGADIPLNIGDDSLRLGIGAGYGQTFVRSKDSSGRNDIDSIPGSVYCNYENGKYPFYLDTIFTFIYNFYKASRAVTVGTLTQRTASADSNGQQYSGYLEGGYSFFYKNLRITPLVSFQYMHLHTGSYTETGADALNLSVNSQDYDMALTGFGAKIAYPFKFKFGTVSPDLHAKWLYDWVGDNQATTASFAGGGTAFNTNGFKAARSGYDIGTKVSFKTKYNISLDLDYDFLLKADYYEHYGSVTVRYSF